MANEVRIHASMKDDVSGPLTRIKDQFTNLSANKAGAALLQGVGLGAGVSIYNELAGAVSNVVGWVGQSADAYRQDQVSVAQLTTSLRDNVAGWNGNTDAIEAVIKSRTRLGFSDEEQRSALASLIAVTKDSGKALTDEGLAMDLARLRGLDLATASLLIGKVQGGNVSILRRYGIEIAKGSTATQALAQIQKLAAGQAEAYANANAGKLAASQDKVLEAQERLGQVMADAESVIMPALADAVSGVVDALTGLGSNIGTLLPIIAGLGIAFVLLQADAIAAAIAATAAWLAAAAPFIAVGLAIAAVIAVLDTLARALGIADGLFGVVRMTIDSVSKGLALLGDALRFVASPLGNLNDLIGSIPVPWHTAAGAVTDYTGSIVHDMDKLEPAAETAVQGFAAQMDKLPAHTALEMAQIGVVMAKYADKLRQQSFEAGAKTDQAFADGLTSQRNEIDNAFQAIVDGLKKPMTRSKEIAHDIGLLTSQSLADGLRSGDPAIVSASQAERDRILERLDQLRTQSGPIGSDAMKALASAMKSKDGLVRSTAQGLWQIAKSRLQQPIDGSGVGTAWITSLANAIHRGANVQLARALANVKGQLAGKSPPKEGPLRNIDKDAEPVGMAWVGGLSRGINRSLGTLSGSLSGVSPALATAGGGGSGLTINVYGVSVLTPGSAEALGRQLGPHIVNWGQRNNLLPRLGTGQQG